MGKYLWIALKFPCSEGANESIDCRICCPPRSTKWIFQLGIWCHWTLKILYIEIQAFWKCEWYAGISIVMPAVLKHTKRVNEIGGERERERNVCINFAHARTITHLMNGSRTLLIHSICLLCLMRKYPLTFALPLFSHFHSSCIISSHATFVIYVLRICMKHSSVVDFLLMLPSSSICKISTVNSQIWGHQFRNLCNVCVHSAVNIQGIRLFWFSSFLSHVHHFIHIFFISPNNYENEHEWICHLRVINGCMLPSMFSFQNW